MAKKIFHILLLLIVLQACNDNDSQSKKTDGGAIYVSPSIDKYGKFRKGHISFNTSTNKDAYKNRIRSKYYYQTRGKYRSRKK